MTIEILGQTVAKGREKKASKRD